MVLSLRSGQSMWVLTKIAMLFFIGALALILVLFGGIVKGGLCQSSAASTNVRIANAINQVINSPLEDERRVIPLEAFLAVGESSSARYTIDISKRKLDSSLNAAYLIISTQSEIDNNCKSALQVSYPKLYEFGSGGPLSQTRLFLISDRTTTGSSTDPIKQTITLLPALAQERQKANNYRSKFIIVMSCTNKTVSREKYLFIEDCANDDTGGNPGSSDRCLNFGKPNTYAANAANAPSISSVCSFG